MFWCRGGWSNIPILGSREGRAPFFYPGREAQECYVLFGRSPAASSMARSYGLQRAASAASAKRNSLRARPNSGSRQLALRATSQPSWPSQSHPSQAKPAKRSLAEPSQSPLVISQGIQEYGPGTPRRGVAVCSYRYFLRLTCIGGCSYH